MKLNRNLLKYMTILISLLLPASFVIRLITYFRELEVSTGFFREDYLFCSVYNGIGFGVFFLCLLLSLVKKDLPSKEKKKKAPSAFYDEEDPFPLEDPAEEAFLPQGENETVFDTDEDSSRFLQGTAKKAAMWSGAFSAFATLLPGFGFIAFALVSFFRGGENVAYTNLYGALSLLGGIFFLIFAFRNSPKKSKGMAFFSLVPAFWCTARMVMEYRDLTRFMNKPLYTAQFLFIIAALFFFLYQAQLLLGDDALTRPNSYAFPGLIVVFFGISARLPELIAGISGKISMDLITSSALLIDLAITLFAAVKLKSILKSDSK